MKSMREISQTKKKMFEDIDKVMKNFKRFALILKSETGGIYAVNVTSQNIESVKKSILKIKVKKYEMRPHLK